MVRVKERLQQSKGQRSAFESAPVVKKRHNVIGDRNTGRATRYTCRAAPRTQANSGRLELDAHAPYSYVLR